MQCLKCGRDVRERQVFCDGCLQDMAAYPVKPGTIIQLPVRDAEESQKRSARKKRELSLKEQVALLRKRNRHLAIATVLLSLLLILSGILLFRPQPEEQPTTGRNYTIDSAQTP